MYKIIDLKGFRELIKEGFTIEHDGKVYPVNPPEKYPISCEGRPMPFGQIEWQGGVFRSYEDNDKTGEEIVKPVRGEFLRLAAYYNSIVAAPKKQNMRACKGKVSTQPRYSELELE
jgi:hypothetical protein